MFKKFFLAIALALVSLPAAAQQGLVIQPTTLTINGTVCTLGSSCTPLNSTTPYVVGNQGVPMVMAGSGSFGNNGALTLTNTIALYSGTTVTSAFVYFPAGAIAASGAGSAAGWYYCLFTTGTAATCYNNTYTSGTPTIPASPTAFTTTGPGAYVGASSTQTAYSVSIPGNTLGVNGGLRLTVSAAYTNSGNTKTITIAYGGSTIFQATPTTTQNFATQVGFKNGGSAGLQYVTNNNAAVPLGASGASPLNFAVDSTQAQNLTVTLANATPASNNLILTNLTAEVVPSVP